LHLDSDLYNTRKNKNTRNEIFQLEHWELTQENGVTIFSGTGQPKEKVYDFKDQL